ncbi:MAG: AAA domain-containing protein [Lentisphaeria bacterium]|nr:AAA domain-containing protein [Lentisphaeria bacterium]
MHLELEKIDQYFKEADRLWNVNPELVGSCQFYHMWEDVCEPRPWLVDDETLTVGGHELELTGAGRRVAWVDWHADELAPVLTIEGEEASQFFLLGLSEDAPVVHELPSVSWEEEELSFGERLEVVYDVIAWMRKTNPTRHVLDITLGDFRRAIEAVAPRHDSRVVRLMKNLSFPFMRKMLKKAAEDMPEDELGPQLTLPFGDTYARSESPGEEVSARRRVPGGGARVMRMPARSPGRISRELEFLAAVCARLAEHAAGHVLDLARARIVGTDDSRGEIGVELPVETILPIDEGDRYQIFRDGWSQPLGELIVGVADLDLIQGIIRWLDPSCQIVPGPGLVARPQQSPWRFIAGAVESLLAHFRDQRRLAGASNAVLGTGESQTGGYDDASPPDHLDSSQGQAWCQAVNHDNDTVLIQGPPGTGKTAVLETVLRELVRRGKRVLVTAPSNAAVDNICRRVMDLPLLRFGNRDKVIAPDVVDTCWAGIDANVRRFLEKRGDSGGMVYAGTHVGCLRDDIIAADREANGLYDVVIFDEAGMSGMAEFLLCCQVARRAVLFGDHRQLPPFPMPVEVEDEMRETWEAVPRHLWALVKVSALEWLNEQRCFPIVMLRNSYRCQNPRLMRFASTLFYNARVRPSDQAEYFRLSYAERLAKYPPSSLRVVTTSSLPEEERRERVILGGKRPGLENPLEARLVVQSVYQLLGRYALSEISVITPYRRQVRLVRNMLSLTEARACSGGDIREEDWNTFLHRNVSTVDSFQGAESDAVIISYVRSNSACRIGFIDDPNRVNVGHTRCRRELIIIGDLDCLVKGARSTIFQRLAYAVQRDGEIMPA